MKIVVLEKKKTNNFDILQHINIGKILDKLLVTTLIAKLYTPNVGRNFETQFYFIYMHLNAFQENLNTEFLV